MDVPGFAIVTGGASGIGRACAATFARDGSAGVALLDLSQDTLLKTKQELEKQFGKCRFEIFALDISQEDQVVNAISGAAKAFGRIDYVVNAAGITIRHEGGATTASAADWKKVLDINLTGSFYIAREAAKVMLSQEPIRSVIDNRPLQRGSIVLIGSILSIVGKEESTGYVAAKHGVLGLARTMSEDYAAQGLRINVLCPGYTDSPMAMATEKGRKVSQYATDHKIAAKRMGLPQEMADGAIWLAGGRSSYVTGLALPVDGGYTQR